MNNIIQADIFFFISSIGFVLLWIMLVVLLFYFIKATRSFNRIMEGIEEDIDSMGDTTKEMLQDVRDSVIFNFIFKKKKRSKK